MKNNSPGTDGQSLGLGLAVTYNILEPRLGDDPEQTLEAYRTYERYIAAGLHKLDIVETHSGIAFAIQTQLNEVFNHSSRGEIQAVLIEGKTGRDPKLRKAYEALVRRAKISVAQSFGLLIDLSVSVESDDLLGIKGTITSHHATETTAFLEYQLNLQKAKAEAALRARQAYHNAKLEFDHEIADADDRRRLDALKQTAEDLEKEAAIGTRAEIARQLMGNFTGMGLLRLEADPTTEQQPQSGVPIDNVIDIESRKSEPL